MITSFRNENLLPQIQEAEENEVMHRVDMRTSQRTEDLRDGALMLHIENNRHLSQSSAIAIDPSQGFNSLGGTQKMEGVQQLIKISENEGPVHASEMQMDSRTRFGTGDHKKSERSLTTPCYSRDQGQIEM